jgi:hypothetical protein
VAVGILTDPAAHRGKTYVPTGPVSLSLAEMATVFTRVLGRPVEYVDIPVERWRQILANLDGVSPHFIEHMSRPETGLSTVGRFRSFPGTLRIECRISVQLASPTDQRKQRAEHRDGDESTA